MFLLSQTSWWALVHELWSFFRPKVKPFGCFIVVVDIPCPPKPKENAAVEHWNGWWALVLILVVVEEGWLELVISEWFKPWEGRFRVIDWQVGNSFAWIVPGPADKTQSLSPQDTKCSGPSSTHYISTCWALKPMNNLNGNETMYVLKIQHVVKYVSGLEPTCLALWRTESLFTSGGLCIFLAYEFPHWPGPLFNGQPSTWSGLKTSGACFV